MAATEQYLSSLSWISSLTQTVGGSLARSPEQMISRDSSFWRFFSRIVTTSVAVQAPSARSTNSIGPGAWLDSRSESMVMAWPDGPVATNVCSPIHFTDAVCMQVSSERAPPRIAGPEAGGEEPGLAFSHRSG